MYRPTSAQNALIRDLSRLITGSVSDPWDVQYKETVQIDNGRVALEPGFVVVPDSTGDVEKTVAFCNEKGLRLTAKCGGHSAAGYCLNNGGVVLDLRNLNAMHFDESTGRLRLGMGCRWSDVYDFLETGRTGLIPVGGGCSSVGVGGFLLGGGYSFLSRSYGLGCDNMANLSIVTANGKTTLLTRQEKEPSLQNLFWASCGGGGGNFGVGVEVELEVHKPVREAMLMGGIIFPFYRITEILDFYSTWVETLPDAMAVYGRIANIADPRDGGQKKLALSFTPVYNGVFAEGVELLQELIRMDPIQMDLYQMAISEWEDFIGTGTSVAGRSAYIRSLVLPPHGLNEKAAHVLKKYMAIAPSEDTFIVWTHGGGKISAIANPDSAFSHRQGRFILEIKAIWDHSKPEDMRKNVEWAHDFFDELTAASGATGAYLNYIDPLLSGWRQKYHGENYERLLEVKKEWDPQNFFRFQQSVGSDFEPDNHRPLDLSPLWES